MKQLHYQRTDGPFGDCTSAYCVYFPEGITVEEFIQLVLAENPDDWGFFTFGGYFSGACLGEYDRTKSDSRFKIKNLDIYNKVKDFHPTRIDAHGGWSRMDYMITTKEVI